MKITLLNLYKVQYSIHNKMLALFNRIPHLGQTTIYRNLTSSVSEKACRSYQENASSDQTLQVMYVVTTDDSDDDDDDNDDE